MRRWLVNVINESASFGGLHRFSVRSSRLASCAMPNDLATSSIRLPKVSTSRDGQLTRFLSGRCCPVLMRTGLNTSLIVAG